jgi:hypothetical protein
MPPAGFGHETLKACIVTVSPVLKNLLLPREKEHVHSFNATMLCYFYACPETSLAVLRLQTCHAPISGLALA